jgi:hypothetical protein
MCRTVARGRAPVFGLAGCAGILERGGEGGAGSLDTEAVKPQLGAEAPRDIAHGCDHEHRQTERFAGLEARKDAMGTAGGVIAELLRVPLSGEDHQREQLEDDDPDHVHRPFDRVGRSQRDIV